MKYERATGVVKREIAGEVFLVPVKQKLADMQNLFVLHGCGEVIWDQLDGRLTGGDLAGRLAESCDVAASDAEKDVDAFLAEMLEAELITKAG
jgi:hypothetical protein